MPINVHTQSSVVLPLAGFREGLECEILKKLKENRKEFETGHSQQNEANASQLPTIPDQQSGQGLQ